MSFKNTLELVTKDIQEIEKIVSNFQNYSRIPAIELDLTLHKLQNLYELLLMIREHEDYSLPSSLENSKVESSEPIKDSYAGDIHEPEFDSIPPVAENPETSEKQIQEIPDNSEINQPSEKSGLVEPNSDPSPDKEKTLAQKYEKTGEFLNEKLGNGIASHPSRLQGGPIKTISGSIGINDRFFYIREIFEGNSESFKKSIENLDKASNFNEAFNYLKSQLMCDMDSEAVQNLLNLVRRKFISAGNE